MTESLYDRVMEQAAEIRRVAAERIREEVDNTRRGASFDEIAERWPEAEAYKGEDPHVELDGLENFVRDEYLSWVDETFMRGAYLPNPISTTDTIDALEQICGTDALDPDRFEVESGEIGEENIAPKTTSGAGALAGHLFEGIETVKSNLSGSDSLTIDAFQDRFLYRIPGAVDRQIGVVMHLRNVMAANKGMIQQARQDVLRIGEQTVVALEASSDSADITATLRVVAGVGTIVAGLVAVPVSGGGSIAAVGAGTTILSGALTTYDAFGGMKDDEESEEGSVTLAADTAEGVLDNMKQALEKVYEKLDDGNDALREACDALAGDMQGTDRKVYYVASRPEKMANSTEDDVLDNFAG